VRGQEIKTVGMVLGTVAIMVGLLVLLVTAAEQGARERNCFEAGGRLVSGVCMPVDGAIKLKERA